jgi:hypothetical protein
MRAVITAILLAASPALAQSVPSGQIPVTIGLGLHSGTFETAGNVDTYRVKLQQGQDYALGVSVGSNGWGEWTVRGPTGTVLGRADAGDGDSGWGFEFRAGRTGYFTIEGRHADGELPLGYSFRLYSDCRDDPKTQCTIQAGQTQGHTLAFGEGVDLVKLAGLTRGRTYTAALLDGVHAGLAVTDGAGKVVAGGGESDTSVTFKAGPATIFLRIRGWDAFGGAAGPYRLSLR